MSSDFPFPAHLLEATVNGITSWLRDCPPARPFGPHVRIFWRAIDHASRLGLVLPAFELRWAYGGERAIQHGETRYDGNKIIVTMNADMRFPEEVIRCTLHEAKHIADFSDPKARRSPPVVLEQRACAFAAFALSRWR